MRGCGDALSSEAPTLRRAVAGAVAGRLCVATVPSVPRQYKAGASRTPPLIYPRPFHTQCLLSLCFHFISTSSFLISTSNTTCFLFDMPSLEILIVRDDLDTFVVFTAPSLLPRTATLFVDASLALSLSLSLALSLSLSPVLPPFHYPVPRVTSPTLCPILKRIQTNRAALGARRTCGRSRSPLRPRRRS